MKDNIPILKETGHLPTKIIWKCPKEGCNNQIEPLRSEDLEAQKHKKNRLCRWCGTEMERLEVIRDSFLREIIGA